MRELPSEHWERFLADGNASTLLAVVQSLPIRERQPDADYPEFHRILDVDLNGAGYRVLRLVDLDDRQERLFIEWIEFPDFHHAGVPYQLRGEALRRWIKAERESPAKDEQAWEMYLN